MCADEKDKGLSNNARQFSELASDLLLPSFQADRHIPDHNIYTRIVAGLVNEVLLQHPIRWLSSHVPKQQLDPIPVRLVDLNTSRSVRYEMAELRQPTLFYKWYVSMPGPSLPLKLSPAVFVAFHSKPKRTFAGARMPDQNQSPSESLAHSVQRISKEPDDGFWPRRLRLLDALWTSKLKPVQL